MTAFDDPLAGEFPARSWKMSLLEAPSGDGVVPGAGVERILTCVDVNAVITPLGEGHELTTVLDSQLGVITAGTFGHVAGYVGRGEQRLSLDALSDKPTTFSFAHNEVQVGSACVRFVDGTAEVRTTLLRAERARDGVDVRLAGGSARALHDITSSAVRAVVAGNGQVDARVGADTTEVAVADDVLVRVSRDDVTEVRTANGGAVFRLDPVTNHVAFTCADGTAGVAAGSSLTITCARSGWRVFATEWLVSVECEQRGEGLVWDRVTQQVIATAELHPGCAATTWSGRELRVDLGGGFTVAADARVRIRWSGRDFVICGGRVVVADVEEDWYLSPDGGLTTAQCVVSAQQTVEGRPEVLVRGAEHEWSASVWAGGAMIDHGGDLRTMLDEDGVVSAPVARADSSVVSQRGASTVVTAGSVQLDVVAADEVRLRSGTAELRVHRRSTDGVMVSAISHDLFDVVVTDSALHGFTWCATHRPTAVSHEVRGARELVVRNSPSGAGITATAGEVRILPAGGDLHRVSTA
ncbi:hypothetical protein [Lentzea sp. NPDC060358]|uniref:hypothetical protein n=1 Tax=Lentzea sp. NPDC060358 TaxID=3347103 RepID=UPI00366110D2